ncbi:MAG: hypothetical protein QOG23_232 [Blastocatellia bacterium]|jgi:cell division protein FtsL|nr:hypothetical protein [Blastocatellia bacterium]
MESNPEPTPEVVRVQSPTVSVRVPGWKLLAFIAGLLPVVSIFVALFSNYIMQRAYLTASTDPRIKMQLEETIERQTGRLEQEIAEMRAQIEAQPKTPDKSGLAIQLKRIETAVTDLQARHAKLEQVIIDNPAKAVEVPLLRKDLDNLKDAQQQNAASLKQSVDQVYDVNKWLLGVMAVSIVTLAVSNLLRGKEKKPE